MSAFYAKGAERIKNGAINLSTATLKVALVKNSYTKDLEADEFYSTISPHVSSTPQALTGVVSVGRTFDANDVTFPAVPAGDVCEALVIYLDTSNPATSPLLLYINQPGTSFPFTGNGDDQTFPWSNGAYKIFSL